MKINVAEYLLEASGKFPEKLAIVDKEESVTYSELFSKASRLAKKIIKLHGDSKRPTPVVVLLPKSCNAVIAFSAISIARLIYVPIDLSAPIERIKSIVYQLGEAFVICNDETKSLANKIGFTDEKIIDFKIDDVFDSVNFLDGDYSLGLDTDPCYIIFTSGSTGTPKGVTVSHRSIIDYIEWAKSSYPVDNQDRLASQAPFYFDNSTLDIYLTLSTGACLYIPLESTYIFPKSTLEYLEKNEITTIFWVPSVLVSIANSGLLEHYELKNLKNVLFAGEVMPVPQINEWVRNLPGRLFSNLYGPTEITVDCTFFSFTQQYSGDSLPIGFPCRNTGLLILNEDNEEAKLGDIGELCVRGSSLALGYWNDFAKTEKSFHQNPLEKRYKDLIYRTGDLVKFDSDGCLFFVGRKDSQIKINGYRVELGEIENAATKIEGVARVACIFSENLKKIGIFLEALDGYSLDVSGVRREIAFLVPKYMVPSYIDIISSFDLNANGKIDRLKLCKKMECAYE